MSRNAKISFLCAFLLVVVCLGMNWMLGFWLNANTMLLLASLILVGLGIGFDYKMHWEFLTMRTTKHGMNMGAMIVVVLVLLICLNYLASLHNKSWDVTKEKLNSLSDQSTQLLSNLKDDIEIKILTKGATAEEEKQRIRPTMNLFSDFSKHVKIRFINPYIDNQAAMEYLNDLPERETMNSFMFVEHGKKRARVSLPFDEAAVTSAIIKVTREGDAKIYFLKGHGEKDIESDGDEGLKGLVTGLDEASIKSESLNLIDRKEVPKDASAIAIVGPSEGYLESELKWIREYMRSGGRLFLALDPGQRTNLANLTKTLGIEFPNNFVVTTAPEPGGGPAMVLGRTFEGSSEITKSFMATGRYTTFYLSSEIRPAPDKAVTILIREIVKTDPYSFTVNSLNQEFGKNPPTRTVTLAIEATGKIEGSTSDKDFAAVVFGDSDFVTNHHMIYGFNRDLALNSFAYLVNQKDLISIRPKIPDGTTMVLSRTSQVGILFCALLLPLTLLLSGGVVWFRRRGA